jgi:hypothetical protein
MCTAYGAYDPALKSPWLFMFEGKLLGDEKLRNVQAAPGWKFDSASAIPGLQALIVTPYAYA